MKKAFKLIVLSFFVASVTTFYGCEKDPEVPEMATLSTNAVFGITTSSASSGGVVTSNGGAEVTIRGICQSTEPGPTVADSKTTDGTGSGAFLSVLDGLTPNTTYYIRAYATNSAGTAYGNEISFSTLDLPPDVTNLGIMYISSSSALAGGRINHNPNPSNLSESGVCWSTSQNPTTADNKLINETVELEFTITLTGLTPGTTYFVRAYAIYDTGTIYSEEDSFTTDN
jgi:hypothetical protein